MNAQQTEDVGHLLECAQKLFVEVATRLRLGQDIGDRLGTAGRCCQAAQKIKTEANLRPLDPLTARLSSTLETGPVHEVKTLEDRILAVLADGLALPPGRIARKIPGERGRMVYLKLCQMERAGLPVSSRVSGMSTRWWRTDISDPGGEERAAGEFDE